MTGAVAFLLVSLAAQATRPAPLPAEGATPALAAATAPRSTIVILVRHAEKSTDDPRDPSLSEAGRRRAELFAGMLGAAAVTHLYATEFRRTQETLQPLAARAGLPVYVIVAGRATAQVEALRALPPGSVAVVAGHSNTVPGLVRALGGVPFGVPPAAAGEALGDDEYDRLFVVALPPAGSAAGATTIELRFPPLTAGG